MSLYDVNRSVVVMSTYSDCSVKESLRDSEMGDLSITRLALRLYSPNGLGINERQMLRYYCFCISHGNRIDPDIKNIDHVAILPCVAYVSSY